MAELEKPIYKLRKVTENDREFLEKLYFPGRSGEFAQFGWAPEQLESFLKMQFDFQQKSYQMQFPRADNLIVGYRQSDVGRLIIDRSDSQLRLIDILILPEFRGLGIGRAAIADLIAEAQNINLKVCLQVLKTNRDAFGLYEKLGFAVVGENELYFAMESF